MTVNLSIKGVPADVAERLRARAERNHRSLQGELMAIIERAAASGADTADTAALPSAPLAAPLANTRERAAKVGFQRGYKTIEQIAAEHLQRYPQPFTAGPMAVDIIRADRDSR